MAESAVLDTTIVDEPGNIQEMIATHVADINVKSNDNNADCKIEGMAVLSNDKVVAADLYNGTVKLIDTVNNRIMSEFKPEAEPSGVTVCNDDTIAATLPGAQKIVFLKYNTGLVYERDISVDGGCQNLDWQDDKLYVIFADDMKLEVMTMEGVVLQRKSIYDHPEYVTVSAASQRIYVSEYYDGHVIMLDMDFNCTGVYDNDEDDELGSPRQLAVSKTGVMFLCDSIWKTVHLLSPECKKVKILVPNPDGIDVEDEGPEYPWSVCYCDDTRRLYVGLGCNTVKVYQLSYCKIGSENLNRNDEDILYSRKT